MSEKLETITKVLWMLAYDDDGLCDKLVPFYASSEEDAEQQARHYIECLPCEVILRSLRAYPTGFVLMYERLPGRV